MSSSLAKAPELSKFGRKSTAMDVVANCDLRGKFAIVTGANRGIGYETAKALASRGCTVIFGCRNIEKAKEAVANIKKQNFSAQCDPIHLDLSSLESVRHFVEEYMTKYDSRPLHYLVLNAAVFPTQHQTTADGYEVAYQTQLISNFFLVRLLGDKLVMSAPSRIVVLSCEAVQLATEDAFSEKCLNDEFFAGDLKGAEWVSENIYANSKVLSVALAMQLSRNLAAQKVCVLIAQPGSVRTSLYQGDSWKDFITRLSLLSTQSAEEAAATSTMCCVQPGLERYNGCCFTDCQLTSLPNWIQNEELHKRLWTITETAVMRPFITEHGDKLVVKVNRPPQRKHPKLSKSMSVDAGAPMEAQQPRRVAFE